MMSAPRRHFTGGLVAYSFSSDWAREVADISTLPEIQTALVTAWNLTTQDYLDLEAA